MRKSKTSNSYIALILLFIAAVALWAVFLRSPDAAEQSAAASMRGFTLILWSILLEALPFVLLGTIISSLIQVFVTEDMIMRILPKNNFLRLVFASLIGLIFPVCECAIIPITRGLIKKGMPTGPAIAFMIATPIVNPIVLFSTYNAFPTMPQMVIYRAVCGFIGAILIGLFSQSAKGSAVLKGESRASCACGHEHGSHSHSHDAHQNNHSDEHSHRGGYLAEVIAHTNEELQSVGAYLIFGAMIAASMQMLVPKSVLSSLSGGRVVSILVMMLLAFVLSLCSEADAFVASTFLLQFSGASVLAFLITGPMIDIKNTMMLLGSFKKSFVARVIITILAVCFALALAASFIIGGSHA